MKRKNMETASINNAYVRFSAQGHQRNEEGDMGPRQLYVF